MKLLFNLKNVVFILLGVSIPISVALTNILIVLFVFLWLIEGGWSRKLSKIKSIKWVWSLISLAILYMLGLIYGDNHNDSIYVLQRVLLLFFFIPLITTDFKQSTYRYAIITFLITNMISALIAIGINYEIIQPIHQHLKISAFLQYNYHNILLSFSSLLSFFLFTKSKSRYSYLYLIFIVIYSISIFSEAGRAGQLTFNVFFVSYALYFLNKRIKYSLSIIGCLVFVNFYSYNNSGIYKYRLDRLTHTVQHDGIDKNTNQVKAKNIRYVFHEESYGLIKKKLFFGYGTGSFASVFRNTTKSSYMYYDHKTPHNNFLYILFELGVIGLLTFLSFFYFQIKDLFSVRIFRYERLILPLFLIFLMLFDSYLFIFTITLFYQFMFTIFRGIKMDSKD